MDMQLIYHNFIKKCVLFVLLVLITFNTAYAHKVVIFMDNSGSIKQFQRSFFRNQIRKIFRLAERLKDLDVVFIPIGNQPVKEKKLSIVTNADEIEDVFQFRDSYTHINDTLKRAEEEKIITNDTKLILFISDMEPDITNTEENWQLLAKDYQDLLNYYQVLQRWVKSGKELQFILLNHPKLPTFKKASLLNDEVIRNLKSDITDAIDRKKIYQKNEEKKMKNKHITNISKYIYDQNQNQYIIQKVLRSLIYSAKNTKCSYETLLLDERTIFYSIVESILDPTLVTRFKVKIEFEKQIVDCESTYPFDIIDELNKRLPKKVGKNPVRYLDFTYVNGSSDIHDKDYDYHFHFIRSDDGIGSIFFTYKKVIDGEIQIVNEDNKRAKFDFPYTKGEIISITQRNIDMIDVHHLKDFPIGQKLMYFTLINSKRTKQNLPGFYLKVGKYESEPTDKESKCSSSVARQGNVKVLLKNNTDQSENVTNMFELQTLSEEIIQNNDTVKINVPDRYLTDIHFKLNQKMNSYVNVTIIQSDQAKIQELETFSFKNAKKIPLIPNIYYCNINSNSDKYLNHWFKPLYVYNDVKEKDFLIEMKEDAFFYKEKAFEIIQKELAAIKDKLKKNDLSPDFTNYILGSKFFLYRLLEFLDANHTKYTEIKELWKRIRSFLYESTYSNSRDAFLYHAYLNIGLVSKNTSEPTRKARHYLKLMMDRFIDGKSQEEAMLNLEEKKYYKKQFLSGFLEPRKLNYVKQFLSLDK